VGVVVDDNSTIRPFSSLLNLETKPRDGVGTVRGAGVGAFSSIGSIGVTGLTEVTAAVLARTIEVAGVSSLVVGMMLPVPVEGVRWPMLL
jgi:hypothetical protein